MGGCSIRPTAPTCNTLSRSLVRVFRIFVKSSNSLLILLPHSRSEIGPRLRVRWVAEDGSRRSLRSCRRLKRLARRVETVKEDDISRRGGGRRGGGRRRLNSCHRQSEGVYRLVLAIVRVFNFGGRGLGEVKGGGDVQAGVRGRGRGVRITKSIGHAKHYETL